MKKSFGFIFLLIFGVTFSQKKISKTFKTLSKEINIYTKGLDNLQIENSNSDLIEVFLSAESYDDQLIEIENTTERANVKFDFRGTETREVIFRKFITKRLQKANAIVKIPKNKQVYVFGENVDIESKSINNNLSIYIDNGIVKLHTIKANTILKLYAGNVYATAKKTDVKIISNLGKILIDSAICQKQYLTKTPVFTKKIDVHSIKANIFLTTK